MGAARGTLQFIQQVADRMEARGTHDEEEKLVTDLCVVEAAFVAVEIPGGGPADLDGVRWLQAAEVA
jgi:hypothetical protein